MGSKGRLATWLVAIGVMVGASACGNGGDEDGAAGPATPTGTAPSPTPAVVAPCHPEGAELHVEAESSEFDTDCLAAPADTPFTIEFVNNDQTTHNVAILAVEDGVSTLFRGEIFAGPETVTYEVEALPAGIHEFRCSVHGGMRGDFVVE